MDAIGQASTLRHSITLAGEAGELYAIFGKWDDYVEIVLPEKPELVEAAQRGVSTINPETAFGSIDVRFHNASPPLISILALYVSAPEHRSRSRSERLSSILEKLARAVPAFDFGDLLREQSTPALSPSRDQTISTAIASSKPAIKISLESVIELARRGQVNKALRSLDGILLIQPNNYDAWKFREELRLLERREKRRRREPYNLQAQLEVGFSYLLVERNEDAAEALARATKINPNQYLAHLLLGIALHRQGQVKRARSAYRRAAKLRPDDKKTLEGLLDALDRGEPPLPIAETRPAQWSIQPAIEDRPYVQAV